MQRLRKNWTALHENHVLIVTTNSNERRAMLEVLDRHQKLVIDAPKQRAYLGHCEDSLVVVLDGDGGFASEDAATRLAMDYLKDSSYPRPSLVLIGGVCWGNPSLVEAGDVIVCGDIVSANRSTTFASGSEVKFYNFKSLVELPDLVAGIEPKPKCGDLISLEVRLSDEKMRDALLKKQPLALGGEMEAFALIPECKELPWLVVKAVSDFATIEDGREEQSVAAQHAARVVRSLLKRFRTTMLDDQQEQTKAAAIVLIKALNGKNVVISHDQFHPDEEKFTSALQAMFSEQIFVSTTMHTNAVGVDGSLAEDITSLLLEVASNAFRYGRAKKISIEFDLTGVKYSDDATAFNVATLKEGQGRGGQAVYKRFVTHHLNSGLVQIKSGADPKGNRISIRVLHKIVDLRNIIDQCSAQFDRTALSRQRHALIWSPTCKTVFVDMDAFMMMSVLFDVCDDITASVNSGVEFLLLCSDPDRVAEVISRYSGAIDSGQIRFVLCT